MQEFFKKNIKRILITVLFLTVGVFYVFHYAKSDVDNDEGSLIDNLPVENENVSAGRIIMVYVCGQVNNPGVYELEDGSRVIDAVAKAGGLTEQAYADNINLAEFVADGQKIYIEAVQENNNSTDTRININSATKQELMSLPGIGESRAEDILAYRNSKGRFDCIEDIMKVPGIKESAFSKIESYIRVY